MSHNTHSTNTNQQQDQADNFLEDLDNATPPTSKDGSPAAEPQKKEEPKK